jgi:hypothetical protein
MAAPAWTTPRRQSYGSLLCQHADSGNWRKLTHGWALPVIIIIKDHADGEPFSCHSPSALLVFPATVWCISNYPFLRCNTPYYVVGRPFPSSYELHPGATLGNFSTRPRPDKSWAGCPT